MVHGHSFLWHQHVPSVGTRSSLGFLSLFLGFHFQQDNGTGLFDVGHTAAAAAAASTSYTNEGAASEERPLHIRYVCALI